MNKSNFFFAYNKKLFSFLHDVKGIEFITVAQCPTTKKIFGLFFKNDELQKALDEYKLIGK